MGTRYGRYLLDRRLAIGGMAEVFLGRVEGPAGFEKKVVIKRILPHHCNDKRYVDMFLDEARIAARFNHPNLVQIHELAKIQGQFCMVMEYIEGKDLENVRDLCSVQRRFMPLPIAAFIIAEAAEGLHYAHELRTEDGEPLSVVHRDVSPANIIMTWIGGVKVVDFGIAKHNESQAQTEAGVIKGKFSYLSPEQASGRPIDRRSDIFSLGTVLYELLTLAPCFTQASPFETLDAVALVRYRPVHEFRNDVPEELETILRTMLQKEPTKRQPNAVELSRNLRHFMGQAGVPVASDVQEFLEQLFGRTKPPAERSYNPLSSGPEVPVTQEFSNPAVGVPEAVREQLLSQLSEVNSNRASVDLPKAKGQVPTRESSDRATTAGGGAVENSTSRATPTVPAVYDPAAETVNLGDLALATVNLGQEEPQETWDDQTVTTASPNFTMMKPPAAGWDAPTTQGGSPFLELSSDDELWGDKTRAEDALWGDNTNPQELWGDKTVQQDVSHQLPIVRSSTGGVAREKSVGPLPITKESPFGEIDDPFSGPSATDPFELSATSLPFEVSSESIPIMAITADDAGRRRADTGGAVGIEDIGYRTLADGARLPRPSSKGRFLLRQKLFAVIGGVVALVAMGALAGWIFMSDSQPVKPDIVQHVMGSLKVESSPPGATVYVDGLVRGETPLTVGELPAGSHRVTAALEGYPPATENVTISAAMSSAVMTISLSQAGATAKIRNALESAAVDEGGVEGEGEGEVEGEGEGKGSDEDEDEDVNEPIAPPPRVPEPQIKKAGGDSPPTNKRSDDGKASRPRHGFLNLSCKPNADVILNGQTIGTTPLKGYKLPTGSHTLQLRGQGMQKTLKVSVRGGDTIKRDVQFGKGKVYVSVSPWAEVYLSGTHLGTTPMPPFSVWEGVHELKLVNPQLGIERKKRINVRANETVKVVEKLQ